jgi:hypothetical protein
MDPNNTFNVDALAEKWKPLLEHSDLPKIEDNYKRNVTAILLENEENALREQAGHEGRQFISEAIPANSANGGIGFAQGSENANMQGYDPILISLVRRSMPNLMAYDICGVQPMTGPTGLIFAMKSKYVSQGGTEALFNEPATKFAGSDDDGSIGDGVVTSGITADPLLGYPTTSQAVNNLQTTIPAEGLDAGRGMSTAEAEQLGDATGNHFNQMAFSIERTSVVAKTRALKAEYTTELAQDLKAVHGLDAETELANILSTEILAEINREVVRTIYRQAKLGAQHIDLRNRAAGFTSSLGGGATSGGAGRGLGGVYDLDADSDGRWSAERFRGLMFQIEREANVIAKQTRRGKGNFIVCSADVASALAMGGFLNISPALNVNLNVDDTASTFAGVLNGKMKVYVDPYAGAGNDAVSRNFCVVGYRGTSPYDAGMFYCPYVPLQMVRAVGENTFQPKIGFKTRYGLVNNPFVSNSDPTSSVRVNQYYRIFRVDNLHGLNDGVASS